MQSEMQICKLCNISKNNFKTQIPRTKKKQIRPGKKTVKMYDEFSPLINPNTVEHANSCRLTGIASCQLP